jgi:hypothetical protein
MSMRRVGKARDWGVPMLTAKKSNKAGAAVEGNRINEL